MLRIVNLIAVLLGATSYAPVQSIHAQATPVAVSSEEICAPYLETAATPASNMDSHDNMDMDATPADIDLSSLEFDLLFIDAMIPHHKMAIAMAIIIRDRSERPEIDQMAENIVNAQQGEVDLMSTWRIDWYPNVPALTERQLVDAMNMQLSESPGVGGVAGLEEMGTEHMAEDIAELCTTTDDVDLVFIDLMIEHHSSAVILGQVTVDNAVHPEIVQLAGTIVQDQQAEIDQLLVWRDQWFPGEPFPDHHDG